jgi:hypothetical protein
MKENHSVTMTIGLIDPDLEPDEREKEAKLLMAELREIDEVESVDPVPDPSPPAGSKAFGGLVEGFIATKVASINAAKFINYLGKKLTDKPISLEVEQNGNKMKVTANNRQELEAALEGARKFIAEM